MSTPPSAAKATSAGRPVMYTTSWCGYCGRLKAQLSRAGIGYDEVDIDAHPDAAAIVTQVNRGNRTVPTVVFADGSAMTNPSARQVADKVASIS